MVQKSLGRIIKQVLPESIGSKLSGFVWQALDLSWELPSNISVRIDSVAEWVIYNDIFVNGEYDRPIDIILDTPGTNPLILDIGSNVGYFGLRFADKWLRKKGCECKFDLVGVEGSPKTYSELRKRMNQPPLCEFGKFYLGLVGMRTGKAYIRTSRFHVTDSISAIPSRSSFQVSYIDLDSIIAPDRRISLLKCDIEGSEEVFLENYPDLLKRTDLAVIELHSTLCNTERCYDLLNAAGLAHYENVRKCGSISVEVFRRQS
jgi:FkbM family methyltransferase